MKLTSLVRLKDAIELLPGFNVAIKALSELPSDGANGRGMILAQGTRNDYRVIDMQDVDGAPVTFCIGVYIHRSPANAVEADKIAIAKLEQTTSAATRKALDQERRDNEMADSRKRTKADLIDGMKIANADRPAPVNIAEKVQEAVALNAVIAQVASAEAIKMTNEPWKPSTATKALPSGE